MRGEGLEREESEAAIMTAKADKEGGGEPNSNDSNKIA